MTPSQSGSASLKPIIGYPSRISQVGWQNTSECRGLGTQPRLPSPSSPPRTSPVTVPLSQGTQD